MLTLILAFNRFIYKYRKAFLVMTAVAIVGGAYATIRFSQYVTKQQQELRGRAETTQNQVSAYLFPKEISQAPGTSFTLSPKLVGPKGKRIGSVLMGIRFDPSHIKLLNVTNSSSGDPLVMLKSTGIEEAKTTGFLKFFSGAGDSATAPEGAVNLPILTFTVIKDGQSTITIDPSVSQVVFTTKEIPPLVVLENAQVGMQSLTAIPTLQVSPSSVAGPTATPKTAATPSRTLSGTATASPAVSPTRIQPSPTRTTPPSPTGSALSATPVATISGSTLFGNQQNLMMPSLPLAQ